MDFESIQNGQESKEVINTGSISNFENKLDNSSEDYIQIIKDKIKALQNRHEDLTKQSMAFRDSSGPVGVDSPILKALEDEIDTLTKELEKNEGEIDDFETQKNKLFVAIDKMGGVYSSTLDEDLDVDEREGKIVDVIMGKQGIRTIPRSVIYGSEKNLRVQVEDLIELRKSELN
jgi:predicted RNase H-like nuclease (RuvC/YqgF family)